LERGGAEQVLKLLVKYADPRLEHCVYAFSSGPMAEELEALGASVTIVRRRLRKFDPSLVWRLSRALRADGIALVHTHIFGACLHGLLAARLAGRLPVVVTEHNVAAKYNTYQLCASRYLYRWARKIVGVSEEVGHSIDEKIRVSPARVQVVPNGIDVDHFANLPTRQCARTCLAIPSDARVVGSVGRLTQQKAYADLVDAVGILLRQGMDIHLVLVGEGEERSSLERRAAKLGMAERVHLVGVYPDVREMLPAFDVFVLSSLWEGLPIALLEAMAANLPCAATAAGGIVSVIEDEVNGLLVPLRDKQGLAMAIRRILDNPQLARDLAECAVTTVRENFSAQRMTAAYEATYWEVLRLP